MKKWIKKLVAGAVVLSSSIGLAGCNILKEETREEGYVFEGYEDTYQVNDIFSIVGTKLFITDAKGNTEEVSITHDMIKEMPDMTTAGEKKVVIEYKGVEYEFTITIEDRGNEQLIAKLQDFLRKYESNKDSLIEAGMVTNLQAKYLDEVANINENEAIYLFSQMFKQDKLLDATYNSLFDAIVQGSFDINENFIISSNELKANLDTLKVLQSASENISNFDIRTYIIDLILPHTDVYYIDNVSEYICYIGQIESQTGKRAIKNVVSTYYYKLKNFEQFEIVDAYTELLNKINVYSTNPIIKQATADLNTKDPETILHMLSNIIRVQWLNYSHVMTTDNYAVHSMTDVEPVYVNTTATRNLIRKNANAEADLAYGFECALKDLVNCTTGEEFKNIILDAINNYEIYASTKIEIIQTQKDNNTVIVMEEYGYCSSTINGAMTGNNFNGYTEYSFEPDYDEEIAYYTDCRDMAQKFYGDIDDLGVLGAVKENQLVEMLIEMLGNYPEEHKQEAINTIYSILDEGKTGKDLYLALMKVLTPNENDYYVDFANGFISEYLGIESLTGQDEIREIIAKYFNNITTATEFNIRDAYTELLTAINIYSTDEVVKTATADLKDLDIEQMIHIVSDIVYTNYVENTLIVATGKYDYVYIDYQIIESQTSQDLIDRYATNFRNKIRAYEDAIWNLLNATTVEDLFDIALDFAKDGEEYSAEEVAIVEALEENKWVLGEEYEVEYFDGYEYNTELWFSSYYYFEQDYDFNEETQEWEYVWVGFERELGWLNENLQDSTEIYSTVEMLKQLVFEPQQAVNQLIDAYKQEIVDTALEICYSYLAVEPESFMADDLSVLFANAIDDYLAGTFDVNEFLTSLEESVNTYANGETKAILGTGYMLYAILNYDEAIDYNEIFKDIELPIQVASVDFNKLMSQLSNIETYDAFNFNNIEVEYIQDEGGNIVAEKLTLKVDVDFDTVISSLKGDVVFTLTLDFNPEIDGDLFE